MNMNISNVRHNSELVLLKSITATYFEVHTTPQPPLQPTIILNSQKRRIPPTLKNPSQNFTEKLPYEVHVCNDTNSGVRPDIHGCFGCFDNNHDTTTG